MTEIVMNSLKSISSRTELSLSGKAIGSLGVSLLCDSIKSNSTLTYLDLTYNAICDEGACALSDSLKSNSTLTALYLKKNSIGDSGARALSDALKSNSTLTKLHLESSFASAQTIQGELALNNSLCYWEWPIQLEKMPDHREMIETLLVCFNELGFPEELEKLLINFFGISFKILHDYSHKT